MSLILDALRKSEAERRRGQPPDLFSAHPQPAVPARTVPHRWLVATGCALLAALAWGSWSLYAAHAPQRAPGSTVHEGIEEPQPRSPPDVTAQASATTPANARSSAALTPPLQRHTGDLAPTTRTATLAPDRSGPQLERITAEPVSEPPPPAPPIATNDPSPSPTDIDSQALRPAEPALPTLASLDASARNALPPLRLSMHVWDAQASRRFAIIDGQRVAEGSRVGNSVVAQIRRDGVVLDVGGQSVLLPRP